MQTLVVYHSVTPLACLNLNLISSATLIQRIILLTFHEHVGNYLWKWVFRGFLLVVTISQISWLYKFLCLSRNLLHFFNWLDLLFSDLHFSASLALREPYIWTIFSTKSTRDQNLGFKPGYYFADKRDFLAFKQFIQKKKTVY